MKVICIDNRKRPGEWPGDYLIEGNVYTIRKYWDTSTNNKGQVVNDPVYTLWEFGEMDGFAVDKFVPLSSIDETEMIREYNLTPEKLKAHSISWYTERLKTEKRIEARSFLRSQLYFLKKSKAE